MLKTVLKTIFFKILKRLQRSSKQHHLFEIENGHFWSLLNKSLNSVFVLSGLYIFSNSFTLIPHQHRNSDCTAKSPQGLFTDYDVSSYYKCQHRIQNVNSKCYNHWTLLSSKQLELANHAIGLPFPTEIELVLSQRICTPLLDEVLQLYNK